jgi:hypothetical protein
MRARVYAGKDGSNYDCHSVDGNAQKSVRTRVRQQISHTTMDSRHVEKGQKLASKSSSSHEDLEELSSVVDGKIVSDDHSLPKSAGEPKVTLNTIVMAIVVVGIILFASFQITECVSAHENPGSRSKVVDVNRTFPGLMFCPFGRNAAGSNQCPIWSPDAYLSFDFSGPSIFGPDKDPIHFYNTNVDTASRKKATKFMLFKSNQLSGAITTLVCCVNPPHHSLTTVCCFFQEAGNNQELCNAGTYFEHTNHPRRIMQFVDATKRSMLSI